MDSGNRDLLPCLPMQDGIVRLDRQKASAALLVFAMVLLLSFAACIDARQARSQTPQTISQDQGLVVLSRCLVSIYEAVRFAAVNTQGGDAGNLKQHSKSFQGLLTEFDQRCAQAAEAPGPAKQPLFPGAPTALQEVGAALNGIGATLTAGNREGLMEYLLAAKFAIGQVRDLISAGQVGLSSGDGDGVINELTHLIVGQDRRSVRFFGSNNPAGPTRTIPYGQLMAAALRLPEERGKPGKVGSIPGFSLLPTAEFMDHFKDTTRNDYVATLITSGSKSHRANLALVKANLESLKGQALKNIIATLKIFLNTRLGRRKTNELMDRIVTANELSEALDDLKRRGLLRRADAPTLNYLIQAAITESQTSPGTILFFPKVVKPATSQGIFTEPAFYGIESDTRLAKIVFESDVALKTLAGPAGQALKRKLPFHQTHIEWRLKHTPVAAFQQPGREGLQDPLMAVNIRPGKIGLKASADGRIISFQDVELTIRTEAFDPKQHLPKVLQAYGDFLTRHFDDYARHIGPLWEMRELAKVIAAARYLKPKGVTVDLAIDRSWKAPGRVAAEWDIATLGAGSEKGSKSYIFARSLTGGVGLQIEKNTDVSSMPAKTAGQLSASAGLASGRPIASSTGQLATMDHSDAQANLQQMEPRQLEDMESQIAAEQKELQEKIQRAKMQETRHQYQASSPPDLRSWKDAAHDMYKNLPGVSFMEQLGKGAAKAMDPETKKTRLTPKDLKKAEKGLQKGTDDVLRAQGWAKTLTRIQGDAGGPKANNLVESTLTIVRESARAYRAIDESKNWKDAAAKAAPHVGNVLAQLPEQAESYFPAASTGARISLKAGSKASAYLEVAKVFLEISYEAANIKLINEGIKREREANRLLLLNMAGNRKALEKIRRDNHRLLGLIAEEKRARALK